MTGELAKALVKAQAEMPKLKADQTNPHFRNEYVSLDQLIAKAIPVLNKHGIAAIQAPTTTEGHPALRTILIHESGDTLEDTMLLILDKQNSQGQGSALTYARRYALTAMLGIGEGDDDGNAASTGEVKRAAKPAAPPANPSNGAPGEAGMFVINFGQKHKGKTIAEVAAKDNQYLDWYLREGKDDAVKSAILGYRADQEIPF